MRIQTDRLRPNFCVGFVFIAFVVAALLFTTPVWGQTPETPRPRPTPKPKPKQPLKITGTVEIGAQIRETQGAYTAKFEEVRDVPKGLFVQNLKLDLDSVDSPYFIRFRGTELRELDQRITLDAGRFGKYRAKFVWDQTPHHFGIGQSFLVKTAPGVYSVSATLRAQLQALTLPDSTRTPANGPLSTLVRQELLTAPKTEVRLRRDRATFRQSYQATDNVELHAQFSWLSNRGTRPMSAGTFVRRNLAGPPPAPVAPDIGGIWEGIGQEFLEPLDQRTYDLKIGARFRGKRWSAGVDYDLSLFRNRISTLTFENPFRVTDEEGCLPAVPPQTCGATNRFKTVRWQTDLAPNNEAQTITFWAKFDLTTRTQVRGMVSLSQWTQNDAFLPYTLNTAIVPRHWDAVSPVTNPTDVNQLPAQSANGKVRNINQQYALVNRRNTFQFQAQYRSQSVDNRTPLIIFPGYAAFGDSTWRAARTDFFNLPIENLDWDFRRQNAEAGFEWDVLPSLTWKLDYEWEAWNRKNRDVNRNNEHSIRNRLDFEYNLSGDGKRSSAAPTTRKAEEGVPTLTTLRLKLDHTYSNRRALVYNTQPLTFCAAESTVLPPPVGGCPPAFFNNGGVPGAPAGAPAGSPQASWVITPTTVMRLGVPTEFNLLRRYDQSDRTRHEASFTLELLRGPSTSLSASYRYLGDEHDKNFYGRLFNRFAYVDVEFTHAFESGAYLYASYSRESNRYAYRDLAHLLPTANPLIQGIFSQFPIANTWERTSRNNLDSFNLGINAAPQEGPLKDWQFDLAYAYSFTRDRISTLNPYAVRADSIIHAGANPYPDTVVRRQDVNLVVSRRVGEKYEVGVRYWYEPYTQDDFSYNVLQPYVHGNITSDAPKYLFQNARYGSYHANVATVFLRYSF